MITRQDIFHHLALLNSMLHARGKSVYRLDMWSPGDGWTRYQLVTDDSSRELSRALTRREMYEVLLTLTRFVERS